MITSQSDHLIQILPPKEGRSERLVNTEIFNRRERKERREWIVKMKDS